MYIVLCNIDDGLKIIQSEPEKCRDVQLGVMKWFQEYPEVTITDPNLIRSHNRGSY